MQVRTLGASEGRENGLSRWHVASARGMSTAKQPEVSSQGRGIDPIIDQTSQVPPSESGYRLGRGHPLPRGVCRAGLVPPPRFQNRRRRPVGMAPVAPVS